MTTINVSVDATWRLSRLEFSTPVSMMGTAIGNVIGHTEVMLTEPATPSEGADVLRSGLPNADPKTYGAMPGAMVMRFIDRVMDETVEVEGVTLSLTQVMDAMKEFVRRWRAEDMAKPPAQVLAFPGPQPPPTEVLPPVRDPITLPQAPPPIPPASPKV